MTEDLQNIMEREWQEVRRDFYYPQLPQPKLSQDVPNGQFNFENLQITVNPDYVQELKKSACDESTSFNAILGHETGHFIDYPGSVLNLLRLQKIASENLDEQKAYYARETFLNVQNNTNLVENKGYESIPKSLKSEAIKSKNLDKIFFGLYQKLWKTDFGLKLKKEENNLIERLSGIDYLDKTNEENNFRGFIDVIKEYMDQHQDEKYESKDHDSGSGFSDNQMREGIRQFAQESQPGDFEEVVKQFLEKSNGEDGLKEQESGKSAGTEKGNIIIARNFYSALAENFSIPIRKKQIQKNGSLYPHSHEEFSLDDHLNDLDPFSSHWIIPGITQKWIKKEGEVTTDYSGIPDSLIVIDSSGSMPNPDENVSIPVLGASVIANAYLNNGSKVTIYNFSADNLVFGPSNKKENIHKIIRTYQSGGTVFSTPTIENIVKEQKSIDISVVSDMGIHNLDEFLSYISGLPNVHRVHLFYTDSGDIRNLSERLKDKKNVAILPLHSQDDIKSITMGELKKSIQ